MSNKIEVKTISINNNKNMTDWKGNKLYSYMIFYV